MFGDFFLSPFGLILLALLVFIVLPGTGTTAAT